MNILFFLTPKADVAFINREDSLWDVIHTMESRKYTAIPMLNNNGRYIGTVTEGDILRYIIDRGITSEEEAKECKISRVPLRWRYDVVSVNCNMEDLVDTSLKQNFVPVVDDAENFIGIVRRRDILDYCYKQAKQSKGQWSEKTVLKVN